MGGARPAAGPPARVQDVQGRGRRAARASPTTPPAPYPRGRRSRGALPQPAARPAGGRDAPSSSADAFTAGRRAEAGARRSTSTHVAPVRVSVAEAVEELVDELPRVGRITFRRLTERPRRAARGHRALPRRARAVQAGPGRARPARHLRRHRDRAGSGRRSAAPSWPWPASTATKAERGRTPPERRVRAGGPPGRARPGHRGGRDGGQRPRAAAAAGPAPGDPGDHRRGAVRPPGRALRGGAATASSSCGWLAATATRATPTWWPTSSGSCSTARAPACRRRPWRRWPSSPTSSRSPAARSPASAASTPTACCARCRPAATSTRSAATPGPARPCCGAPRERFLEQLGLDSLADLPPLAGFVPGAEVVEALEQGLRVDPAPANGSGADG